MNKPISSTSCQSGCWILAAVSGVVVLAVCLFLIELGMLASIFMGAVVFIVVGLLLGWIFCSELKPLVQPNETSAAPSAPEPAPAPAPAAEPASVTAPVAQAPEVEAVEDAVRPEALSGARDGGADDLKMIKGVGPKLEIMLNELGFYHFDQIAGWSARQRWPGSTITWLGSRAVSAAIIGSNRPANWPLAKKQSFPNAFLMETCTRRA